MFLQATIQFQITEQQHKIITASDESRNHFTNFMAKFPGSEPPVFGVHFGPYLWVSMKEVNAFADFVTSYEEKVIAYFEKVTA